VDVTTKATQIYEKADFKLRQAGEDLKKLLDRTIPKIDREIELLQLKQKIAEYRRSTRKLEEPWRLKRP